MPENLENTSVATGIGKASFHSNPKEGPCQRMFKLPHKCTHITCWQSNARNPSSQASTVCELKISRCTNWIQKRQRNQRSNCQQISWFIEKAREFQKNIYFCFIDYAKAFDCMDHNNCKKILKERGISDHFTCLLRNLYAGQEAKVRTSHRTMDWFKMGKYDKENIVTVLI